MELASTLATIKAVADVTKTVADIGKDASKPVVEALVAPHVARVREWAAEKDLQDKVDWVLSNLEDAFDAYLSNLYRKVSSVRTLVFPQQDIPLQSIYEPAMLISSRNHETVSEDSLRKSGNRTCIIDSAGMGKSTFVKYLVLSEIFQGELVPLFLELRKIKSEQTLVEALAHELDRLDKPFDRDVFKRLVATRRFLIVLDGFDEVSLAERPELTSQIEELAQKTENSAIVLTSRPENHVPPMGQGQMLTLQPLTIEQAQSLVKRLDAYAGVDVGEKLIEKFHEVPAQMLQTPLLVALLYWTFGNTGAISTKITTFYNELFEALYKGHDLTKASFAREKQSGLGIEEFHQLLCCFAFLLISKQMNSITSRVAAIEVIRNAEKLTGIHPKSPSDWLDDLLIAVPLLVKDGTEIRFVHKTLTEFFAARYLAYGDHGALALKNICKAPVMSIYHESLLFFSEIKPQIFKELVVEPVASSLLSYECDGSALLKTANYLGDFYVRVLKFKYEYNGEIPTDFITKSSPDGTDPRLLLIFRIESSDYCIVCSEYNDDISTEVSLSMPYIIEKNDAKSVESIFTDLGNSSKLPSFLPLGEWIKSTDKVMASASEDIAMEYVLVSFVSSHLNKEEMGLPFDDVFVLSKEQARKVLASVQEKEGAGDWLSELLS